MNASENKAQNQPANPWENRRALPRVNPAHPLLGFLVVALCALVLALVENTQLATIALPILFVYTVIAVRSPASVAVILLTAVAATVLSGTYVGGAVVLALCVGVGTLAWLFTVLRVPYLALLPQIAVFALAWYLTKDVAIAALAFATLPAAAWMAHATVRDRGRTSVILRGQVGLLLSVAVLLIVTVMRIYGKFDFETVLRAVDDLRTNAVNALVGVRDAMTHSLRESGAEGADEAIKSLRELLTRDTISKVVSTVLYATPGVAVMLCGILAFEGQLVLGMRYLTTGWKQVLTRNACVFTMSVLASILYTLTAVATLFFSIQSVLGLAVQNLHLMLLPGFCVLGLGALLLRLRISRGGAKFFLVVLVLAIACCTGIYALTFLGLFGAYSNILLAIHRKAKESAGNGEQK
ncbi:MAG: hypothetical protein IJW30_03810 [Clostridia bacterium]|nr:hypothetical protein [Clostridia bacterium]